MRVIRRSIAALTLCVVACSGQEVPDGAESDLPEDLLDSGAAFIAVPRHVELTAGAVVSQALSGNSSGVTDGDSFYLAIRRDRLDRRYFLSAYLKQLYLDPVNSSANPFTLGTRVVSFKLQNDRLFVIDASDAYKATEVFDNEILVEAYPVVNSSGFNDLRGARNYVLVDVAAGLNRYQVSTGDVFSDPFLYGSFPVRVGLAYAQQLRQIADGITFEQVVTGDTPDGAGGVQPLWATLGLSIRDYKVGDGYAPTPAPPRDHYFLSWDRLVPGTGLTTSDPVKWNLRKGRPPVLFYIGAGAKRAQADFPDIDILGAMKRGIEDWNEVLGYEAFRAVQSDRDDLFAQDDKNVVIVDYPGVDAGFAFADWRHNPNNGEILGGSVYFDSIWFNILGDLFPPDEAALAAAEQRALTPAAERPRVRTMVWGGMPAREPACVYEAPAARARLARQLRAANASLTPQQLSSLYLEHVLVHEMGHVLGLRHNFKGSLVPPSSSVMEYVDDFDAPLVAKPQEYDKQAIRYLYGLSDELPTLPFCTDEDTRIDPTCATFDIGEVPLHEFWGPIWGLLSTLVVDSGANFSPGTYNFYLNPLLAYARRPPSLADGVAAIDYALDRVNVPDVPASPPESAAARARIDTLTQLILRRMFLDPTTQRGPIQNDPSVAAVQAALNVQLGRMLTNVDGIRSYALRRLCIDVLKDEQSLNAYQTLLAALELLRAQLPANPADAAELFDLVNRADRAVTPYFN